MFGLVRKKKVLDYAKEIKVENRAEDIYAKYPTEDVRQEKLNCYSQGYEDGTDKLMGGELCSQMDGWIR